MTPASTEEFAPVKEGVQRLHPAYTEWRVERQLVHFPPLYEAWFAGYLASPPPGGATRDEIARVIWLTFWGGHAGAIGRDFAKQNTKRGAQWDLCKHLADAILALLPVAPPPGGLGEGWTDEQIEVMAKAAINEWYAFTTDDMGVEERWKIALRAALPVPAPPLGGGGDSSPYDALGTTDE
jgi:hypothetical protein